MPVLGETIGKIDVKPHRLAAHKAVDLARIRKIPGGFALGEFKPITISVNDRQFASDGRRTPLAGALIAEDHPAPDYNDHPVIVVGGSVFTSWDQRSARGLHIAEPHTNHHAGVAFTSQPLDNNS